MRLGVAVVGGGRAASRRGVRYGCFARSAGRAAGDRPVQPQPPRARRRGDARSSRRAGGGVADIGEQRRALRGGASGAVGVGRSNAQPGAALVPAVSGKLTNSAGAVRVPPSRSSPTPDALLVVHVQLGCCPADNQLGLRPA
eukprot:scaffold897_cov402-Prasinococcus_capsulatus_cf.AAC.40